MSYKTAQLNLEAQSIAAPRMWNYADTGSTLATVCASAYFSDGRQKGMKLGDIVWFTNLSLVKTYRFTVTAVQAQDTGVQFAEVGDTN